MGRGMISALMERRRLVLQMAAAVGIALFFGLFSLLSVDPHHDGVVWKSALDFAHGMVVFRDSFNQYGFLTTVLQGAALRVFGDSLVVLKLLTVLFYLLSFFALDRLWRRFLSRPFRVLLWGLCVTLAPFYLVVFHPWSSVYALFAMLFAADRMVVFLETGERRELFWSGVGTALAFGFRQPCGVVTLLAGILSLGLWCYLMPGKRAAENVAEKETETNRDISDAVSIPAAWGWYFVGTAAVLALPALYLTLTGAWTDYFRQSIGFVFRFGVSRGGGWEQIVAALFPFDSALVLFPLTALGVFFYSLWRVRDDGGKRLTLAVATLFALASWHQYFPVPCVRHLYWAAIPMFGAFAFVIQCIWRAPWRNTFRIGAVTLLLLPVAGAVLYRAAGAWYRLAAFSERRSPAVAGLEGMLLTEPEAGYFEAIAAAVGRIPEPFRNRPILNLTPDGLYAAIFPGIEPVPHPMFVDWGRQVYADYPERMADYVERVRPVIFSTRPAPMPGYRAMAGFVQADGVYYFFSLPPQQPAR